MYWTLCQVNAVIKIYLDITHQEYANHIMIFYLAPDGENICLHCIAPLKIQANGKSSTESRNQVQQIFPQMQKRRVLFLDSKESGAKASVIVMSRDSFGFSSGTYLLNFFLS